MLHLESLRKSLDQLDNQSHLLSSIKLFLRMQTVITSSAILYLITFSKIVKKQSSAACIRFRICHGLHKELLAYFLLCNRLALHELFELLDVLVAIECYALPFLAIPASSSGLLIIAFYTLRDIIVDDKAHIRLVNTHSECNGRNNHIYLLHEESILIVSAGLGVQAGMIRRSLYSIYIKKFGQFFHFLATEAIYDAGLTGILSYEFDDITLRVRLVPYFII